jgi:hypothetical protein
MARTDARHDIARGDLKLYSALRGPVGIPVQLRSLVSSCRLIDAGFTDTFDRQDSKRLDRVLDYARIYNQEVIRFLLQRSGQSLAELDRALSDQKGEEAAERELYEEGLLTAEEAKRKRANKSLQPTATAVTPPAGQEARQP